MVGKTWGVEWRGSGARWSVALSLVLHGMVIAALLMAAVFPSPPDPVPSAIMVEMIAEAGGGDTPSAADQSVGPKAAEPPQPMARPTAVMAPLQSRRVEAARRPTPHPSSVLPQETSSAAKPASPEATSGVTVAVTAAGGDEEGGTGGQGRGEIGKRSGPGGAPDMDSYLAILRQTIQQSLVYPPAARRLGLAGLVRLRFSVQADGRVDPASLLVVGGSEDGILRQGAIDTIRRLPTVPPPPSGGIGIEVPVNFSLTERR